MTALEILQTLSAYARGEADRRQADAALAALDQVLGGIAKHKVFKGNAHLREEVVASVVLTLTQLALTRRLDFRGTLERQARDYLNTCVLRHLHGAVRKEGRGKSPATGDDDARADADADGGAAEDERTLAELDAAAKSAAASEHTSEEPTSGEASSRDPRGGAHEPSHDPRDDIDAVAGFRRALGATQYSIPELLGLRRDDADADADAEEETFRVPALIELVFSAMLADTEARYHEVRMSAHRCAWVLFYSQAPYAALLDVSEVAAERDETARARAINNLNHRHARYLEYMRKAADKMLAKRKLSENEHATVGRILKLL
jgi:hypothetical protein